MAAINSSDLAAVVHDCFITELEALKPGNVGRHGIGHGMTCDDFERSARAAAPILCREDLAVGGRILAAMRATLAAVGCNTNLGMLLLFAPLVRAYQRQAPGQNLEQSLKDVLEALDHSDALDTYAAIRLAKPGGLGHADKYDVHFEPKVGLCEAMAEAASRDLIALQYTNNFNELFTVGLPVLKTSLQRWKNLEWATAGCYLVFLSRFPDSHVSRKHGAQTAAALMTRTRKICQAFDKNEDPEDMRARLLDYDRELKDANINPGTSADMTAASLLLFRLTA